MMLFQGRRIMRRGALLLAAFLGLMIGGGAKGGTIFAFPKSACASRLFFNQPPHQFISGSIHATRR
jgi:hypothetical protein